MRERHEKQPHFEVDVQRGHKSDDSVLQEGRHVQIAALPDAKRDDVDSVREVLIGGSPQEQPRTPDEEVRIRAAAWSRTAGWPVPIDLDPGLDQGLEQKFG